jgi:hypothetical protein
MNALLRVLALAAASTLAAGCGGGGSNAVPAPLAAPAAPSIAQGKAAGAGTLTIVFPATFQRASKAGSTRATASARRGPAYVNPGTGNLLDIYVDGHLQLTATVSASTNGTQTLSIPLYSQATNDIAIVEYDAAKTYVLAAGEKASTQFAPGTAPIISVSLLMNVQGIALSTSADGSGATTLPATSLMVGCSGSPATYNTFYLFAVDALGGLIVPNVTTTTGYGGSVVATLSAQTPMVAVQPETTIRPYSGGYAISYDATGNPVTIYASVPSNPAASLFNNNATYPSFSSVPVLSGLSTLVNTSSATSAINGNSGALLMSGCG